MTALVERPPVTKEGVYLPVLDIDLPQKLDLANEERILRSSL